MSDGSIYVGIGGWNYEPWRQTFYPPGLPAARELEYASRRLSAIEVNGTYYSTFKPPTFAKWREATPPGFVFALKANRFATNRRVLAEAGESLRRFVDSGIAELGEKLGPIVWQFAPSKRFEPADFEAFLKLLPKSVAGVPLRHALDVRHASFQTPEFLALARRHGAATVFTESDDYPAIADATGPFIYSRIMRTRSELPQGCTDAELDALAASARAWQGGGMPAGLPLVEPDAPAGSAPRDVFMFFISGAKERAPAAAQALIGRLDQALHSLPG
jgi:uncharacterized protein YecE (DUF72 family)